MADKNDKNMYLSALSIYHSAQCVLEVDDDGQNDAETLTIKADSKELIPVLLDSINDTVDQRNTDEERPKIVQKNKVTITKNNSFKNNNYLKIRPINLVFPWVALVLYLLDVLSDQFLAICYATEGQWVYLALTWTFVVLPGFYLSIFVGKTWRKLVSKGWKFYPLILPLVIFNLEPAVQYVKNYLTVRKYLTAERNKDVKNKKKYYDKYIGGNRNVSDLKYSESLMEAIPQFTLQGYIILRNYDSMELNLTVYLQLASLTSSIIGLGVIIFVRHKIWLLAHGFKISEFGRCIWTSGRFFSLVARTLSLTTSASLYTGYTFILIGIHWVLAVICRYITHLKTLGFIEPVFQGAADTLVARVDTLKSNIISNVIILTENIVMMTVWFCQINENYDNIRLPLLLMVVFISVLGAIADILYKKYNKHFLTKIVS